MINIALVDDHSIVREGFKRLLELTGNYTVSVEASNFHQAKSAIMSNEVDVAVIDISLPDKNGLNLIPILRENLPRIKVVVVSMYDNEPYVSEAINIGADAYLSKQNASDEIFEAISAVLKGGSYLGSDIIKNIRFNLNDNDSTKVKFLTAREKEIFNLLAVGYSVNSISRRLNISSKTVHVHKANIYDKLQVVESYELLKIAFKSHSITLDDIINNH
ncbi:hypothetical protein AEA42_04415 [Shewanella sp. Sh95]|uniref:response regulator transcription factor n=1 Tax=Shewanella sp. Sh95 TaxID=1689868 RepID=UPI0006DBBF3F|nr:response regulator transcription factor [Shewanella sp. Sh95]KPN78206.1 hypothetical protein AEA42_04415 [Shewanella sp. Sh95]